MAADVKVWAAGHEGLLRRSEARDAPRDLAQLEAGGGHHGGGDLQRVRVRRLISAVVDSLLGKRHQSGSGRSSRSRRIWKPTRTITSKKQPEDEGNAERQPRPRPARRRKPPAEHRGSSRGGRSRSAGYDESSPKNWYIIHTYSGFEKKVRNRCARRAEAFGFADKIGQILIPTEEVVELRNGKKVTSKRLVYPGYVLVEMEMNDELWHEVKNTPRVTGFVGGGNSPVPLSADEVNSILYRQAIVGGAAAAEDDVREERNGAHRRRTVRELLGQGGRGQSGAQHAARDGDDFRPRDAGGTGISCR